MVAQNGIMNLSVFLFIHHATIIGFVAHMRQRALVECNTVAHLIVIKIPVVSFNNKFGW
jgi:hypothetical protein